MLINCSCSEMWELFACSRARERERESRELIEAKKTNEIELWTELQKEWIKDELCETIDCDWVRGISKERHFLVYLNYSFVSLTSSQLKKKKSISMRTRSFVSSFVGHSHPRARASLWIRLACPSRKSFKCTRSNVFWSDVRLVSRFTLRSINQPEAMAHFA